MTQTTNIVPNLYANPIVSISKDDPALVTVPVVAKIVSTTGTIGTVTGSGTQNAPWKATITLMTKVTGLQSGSIITSSDGSGTFAAGGEVTVKKVLGNKSISINKVSGTIPTAGTVTDITLPEASTLPTFMASGDVVLFTNPGNRFTFSSASGTFQAGEIFTQDSSLATGLVTNVLPLVIEYTAIANVVDTSNVVTGATSGATTTPTTVTGMNELLTAGTDGTNAFYANIVSATTFELFTDDALSVGANSSSFTTSTLNAGQYTTFTEQYTP